RSPRRGAMPRPQGTVACPFNPLQQRQKALNSSIWRQEAANILRPRGPRASAIGGGKLLRRRDELSHDLVERARAVDPPHNRHQVVLPIDVDDVAPAADEVNGAFRRAR